MLRDKFQFFFRLKGGLMLEERNYYKVAIYIRLSREDADKGFDESESIVNQRHLLTEYVEKLGWEYELN